VAPLVPVIGGDVRRRKPLVVLAGLAAVVAVGVVVFWPRPDRITQENYDRICENMRRAEVYAILGPPGDYTTRPQALSWPSGSDGLTDRWWGDKYAIGLVFDQNGRVRVKCHTTHTVLRLDETFFENLAWRAKRQWRRWFPE
jgi:hypothetical protein